MEYSNDSKKTLPYSELFEILSIQAAHFESVSTERKPHTTTNRSYVATVNCEETCVACIRGNHLLKATVEISQI